MDTVAWLFLFLRWTSGIISESQMFGVKYSYVLFQKGNFMEFSAIYHDMDKRYCYAIDNHKFLFRIQVKKDDMQTVILHHRDKYLPLSEYDSRQSVVMRKAASSQFHDYYEAEITFDVICLRYFFELRDTEGNIAYYGNYEFFDGEIGHIDRMFDCPQNLREEEMFVVPSWAKNQVVYQIFPSRFSSSRKVDKEQWYKTPISHQDELYGDLRGIINRLDYLKELGVDVIYMTPIFASKTTHKYDTVDYYQIDPTFGTKEDLTELVNRAHAMGIRVVLDAVFNHTSPEFFAFKDIREKQEGSAYLDWYYLEGFPLRASRTERPNYKSFAYYGGMPKLNLRNPETEEYFLGVARYWLKECGIDGWRLDVGDEIGHRFWKHFREAVKEVNPEALIIGEIWHYAGDFLEGDEWDTVMNYPFYLAVLDFVASGSITATEFLGNLDFMRGHSNVNAYPLLFNLIDSHDTARFLHLAGENKQKQKLAAALQLLMPGMPMIYYGDEYGISGGEDPDCRRGMLWDEPYQDGEMYRWYKRLIEVRKEHEVITSGTLVERYCDDEQGLIILTRQLENRKITIIFHGKEGTASVKKLKSFRGKTDLLAGKVFDGTLGAYETVVIRA